MSKTARGIRNNNPGNIDYNKANAWQGQLPFDPVIEARFARFDSPQNGIRALAKTLLTYHRKHGLKTVAGIIGRWAPAAENDSVAYVAAVHRRLSAELELDVAGELDLHSPQVLCCLVTAIIHHENGSMPYPAALIEQGVRNALA